MPKLHFFFFCYSYSYLKTFYVFSRIVLYFFLTIYFLFGLDSQIDVCALSSGSASRSRLGLLVESEAVIYHPPLDVFQLIGRRPRLLYFPILAEFLLLFISCEAAFSASNVLRRESSVSVPSRFAEEATIALDGRCDYFFTLKNYLRKVVSYQVPSEEMQQCCQLVQKTLYREL